MEVELIFVLAIGVLTASLAYWAGTRRHELPPTLLRPALGEALECLGASVVFLGFNLALGVLAVFAIRGTGHFFSLYGMLNFVVLAISCGEGCVFQLWWRRSHDKRG